MATSAGASIALLALAPVLPLTSGIRDSFDASEVLASAQGCADGLEVSGGSVQSGYNGLYFKAEERKDGQPVYKMTDGDGMRRMFFQKEQDAWCIGMNDWYHVEVLEELCDIRSEKYRWFALFPMTWKRCPDAVLTWAEPDDGQRSGGEGHEAGWRANQNIKVANTTKKPPAASGEGYPVQVPELRWDVWKAAVELPEGELPGHMLQEYRTLHSTQLADETADQIERDVARTFGGVEARESIEDEDRNRLRRVLRAYAASNPEVGYCQGTNFVVGFLLVVSGGREAEVFAFFKRFVERRGLAGLWSKDMPLMHRCLDASDKLMSKELFFPWFRHKVLMQWFNALFVVSFPLATVKVLWDVIVYEGLPMMLKIAVSMLRVMKDSLLKRGEGEIAEVFDTMKKYYGVEGELSACRFGQLLVRNARQVEIPDNVLRDLKGA